MTATPTTTTTATATANDDNDFDPTTTTTRSNSDGDGDGDGDGDDCDCDDDHECDNDQDDEEGGRAFPDRSCSAALFFLSLLGCWKEVPLPSVRGNEGKELVGERVRIQRRPEGRPPGAFTVEVTAVDYPIVRGKLRAVEEFRDGQWHPREADLTAPAAIDLTEATKVQVMGLSGSDGQDEAPEPGEENGVPTPGPALDAASCRAADVSNTLAVPVAGKWLVLDMYEGAARRLIVVKGLSVEPPRLRGEVAAIYSVDRGAYRKARLAVVNPIELTDIHALYVCERYPGEYAPTPFALGCLPCTGASSDADSSPPNKSSGRADSGAHFRLGFGGGIETGKFKSWQLNGVEDDFEVFDLALQLELGAEVSPTVAIYARGEAGTVVRSSQAAGYLVVEWSPSETISFGSGIGWDLMVVNDCSGCYQPSWSGPSVPLLLSFSRRRHPWGQSGSGWLAGRFVFEGVYGINPDGHRAWRAGLAWEGVWTW